MGKICLLFVLSIIFVSIVFVLPNLAQTNNAYADNSDTINNAEVYPNAAKTENNPVQTTDKIDDREKLDFQNTLVTAMNKALSVISSSRSPKNKSLGSFSTGDALVDGYILKACARYDVDPLLIYAQMSQESSFRKAATSHKGASGLMQLMPATARRFGVKNIYNPQQNIEAGVKYMRWLLDEFGGDLRLALAAYNAGEGSVKKFGNQIPPYRETQNYVNRITAHYAQIKL
jgi:soluble lytic murein transglycosylase-like protein